MNDKPFRWNLQNRRSLEVMLAAALAPISPDQIGAGARKTRARKRDTLTVEDVQKVRDLQRQSSAALLLEKNFSPQVLECCARIIALGCEYDLVFVGRSPESLFDHLSGLLFGTRLKERLTLLQFSMRLYQNDKIVWSTALPALKKYFEMIGLDPSSLMRRRRPVAFVDLVSLGTTFGNLIKLLKKWSEEEGIEWAAVRRKIRIIGLVSRKNSSPKTVRWHQRSSWVNLLETGAIKNISLTPVLWCHLGDIQHKSTISFSPKMWDGDAAYSPPRNIATLVGLQLALYWFDLGRSNERRLQFANALCMQPEMKLKQLRSLVVQLRKKGNARHSHRKSGSRKPLPYKR